MTPHHPAPRGSVRAWLLGVGLSLAVGLGSCRAEPDSESRPPLRTLSSDRLEVDVMDPHSPDRYYRGPRFSPVANVLQVRMDGHRFLFAPAKHDPLTENGGLAMEFDIGTEPNPPPPRFNEAAPGEGFLKIGVGVLKKETDPLYKFYTPYAVLQPATTTVEWNADRARFLQICPGVAGYAYRLDAEVRVVANEVRVTCRLANTGAKPFSTEHYAHNFFAFDNHGVGPGHTVEFPGDFTAHIPKPVIVQNGRVLEIIGEITTKIKAAEAFVTPLPPVGSEASARVRHAASGLGIRATVSRPTSRMTVHANPRYLCPEQFIRIDLKPGETADWERVYVFELPSDQAPSLLQ